MATNDTTLSARVQIDDADLRKLPASFNAATTAAKNFEVAATKAGGAAEMAGRRGGGAAGAFGAGNAGRRGLGAANMAFNAIQSSLPDTGVGGFAANSLSSTAQGAMIAGPVGAVVGALMGLVSNFRRAGEEIVAAAQAASSQLVRQQQRDNEDLAEIRRLRDVNRAGFDSTETGALERLIQEQMDFLRGVKGVDLDDAQTRGDQLIIETARTREAAEAMAAYLKTLGYGLEVLKRDAAVEVAPGVAY